MIWIHLFWPMANRLQPLGPQPVNDAVNLYRMNPDGSHQELLYGQQSHDTGTNGETIQFMQPRQVEDGASWCWHVRSRIRKAAVS